MVTLPATELPTDRRGQPLDLLAARTALDPLDAEARLRWASETFGEGLALTTSFGIQSAVLLHMVSRLGESLPRTGIPVIWVDTGYLPAETYRYAEQLQGLLKDLELYNRLRKVEPLDRALREQGACCWASGVRGSQTDHRSTMQVLDTVRGRWTLRPLLSWTSRDIYYYMQDHNLPSHPLFEQGYSTVGDWHTSAPDGGEASGRSTRFGGLKQECGIHIGEGI
jgi:phosphoadenosine phosphosulfate reductase